jgi:hypothetical protein
VDLSDQLLQMASGAWLTQMLHVAAELGLADRLAAGPRPVEELAAACRADADALNRLLRGLAAAGVFRESAPGRYGLTPLAELLRSDHPRSQRQMLRMLGGEHYQAWADLLGSVRSGGSAFHARYGCSVFEHYRRHPDRAEVFAGAMADLSRRQSAALLEAYSFAGVQHLVDVGGGRGDLLQAVLGRYPTLQGTVFDQPSVLAGVTVPEGLAGRLQLVGGDFFRSLPAGADAYLLKHILHDWDDERCLAILARIRAAMAPAARLVIVEQLLRPGNDPCPGTWMDLNMLVMTEGGRERSLADYGLLLERSGLLLRETTPTAAPVSVLEAAPV